MEPEYTGKIAEVAILQTKTEVIRDHVIGEDVLDVLDAGDFDTETGGQVLIGTQVYPYVTVESDDEVQNTITLATPLLADVPDDTEIFMYPLSEDKSAIVETGEEEPDEVRLPYDWQDKMEVGIRDPADQETISYHEDEQGELVAHEIVGKTYTLIEEYVPLPPPGEGGGPTTEPTVVPDVQVYPGSGVAVVRWDTVPDATEYDLYVTLNNTDAIDPSTLYMENVSSPVWVAQMRPEGGATPIPTDDDAYFAIVPRNEIGPGPSSGWIPGRAGLINDEILSSSLAIVQQVIAELVETVGLNIAGGQSWNGVTGLTIPNVVNFPPTNILDAYVWAKLIARSLTIEDFFKMRGRNNEFSAGAKATMADAITNPDRPPAQEASWEQVALLSIPEDTNDLRGIVRESPTTWVSLLTGIGSLSDNCQLIRFVNGVETKRSPILTWPDGGAGFAKHPTTGDFYIAAKPQWDSDISNGGTNARTYITMAKVSADLNTVLTDWGEVNTQQVGFTGKGVRWTNESAWIYPYSSTKFMIAGRAESRLHGLTWDWSDVDASGSPKADGVSITLSDRNPPIETFRGITKGKPPGNDQLSAAPVAAGYWTAWYSGADPFLNGADIPVVERAYGNKVIGAFHDGTYHYTLNGSGRIYRYEKIDLVGQVGYTWRDTVGTQHETAVSPPATIAVPRGAGVLVTPDPPPYTGDVESPDVSQVFARTSSANPWRDHGAGTPTKFIGEINGAATVHGAIASFATAGITPFEFLSQKLGLDGTSLIRMLGNGTWRLGDLVSEGTEGRFESTKVGTTGNLSGTYTGKIDFVRIGQLVFASGYVDRASGFNNASHDTTARIPVGFRPAANVTGEAKIAYGITASYRYRFFSTGVIEIQQSAQIGTFQVADAFWVTEDA